MKTKKTAQKTPKADTLESLLKQRDEIDAKIRAIRRPYALNDTVLVVGTVTDTDIDEDGEYPYMVDFGDGDVWVTLSQIRGKA